MIYYSAALLVGFLVLFKSADQFVIGSVATARNSNISPMVIGLTIVALGTSAPEIFISGISSLQNQPELAVGNAIGSNIANIGMVLGITAIMVPLKFRVDILRNDMPIMVFVTLCAGATLIDYRLGIWDGVLLLAGLCLFLFRLASEHRRSTQAELTAEIEELGDIPEMSNARALITFVVALMFLLLSSELLVWAVKNIATSLGVGELLIGLTVIAVGTSLPELVVSVTSAFKDQTDMAIGNIVGSNIFNILAVLSIPCVISPTAIQYELLWRDYILMLGLTMMLVCFAYIGSGSLNRIKGMIMVSIWVSYLALLYFTAIDGSAARL
ncbi:MAG: calcium/sodium antiporter [Pseudomonadales bacterium]|nr:calcium/sodium antiporter [Pseudomonadales bacterium]MBO6566007.1 calcium/sodium antiporter [Pseudomonadales bacterium]MBO6594232.1 calcium/sodium antiporter [Pseudomonadales bacterium]MBO6822207.1 calcium/sodium antiporter [Pseudomonadales bacterium]